MIINFILFQLGWFACVLGGAWNYPWAGPLFAIPVLAWHAVRSATPRGSLQLVLAVTCLGALADLGLVRLGVLRFPDAGPMWMGLPLWMPALWLMFATTLDGCMRWLQRYPLLAAVLGAVAGPLAYLGGDKLAALTVGDGWHWIALEWAVLLPVGVLLARRWSPTPRASLG